MRLKAEANKDGQRCVELRARRGQNGYGVGGPEKTIVVNGKVMGHHHQIMNESIHKMKIRYMKGPLNHSLLRQRTSTRRKRPLAALNEILKLLKRSFS